MNTKSTRRFVAPKKLSSQNAKNFHTFLLMQEFAAREIGERIAKARKETGGMTQDQLADLVNVSDRSIQDYEAGVRIPYKHLHRISEVLNRSVGWFLHGEPTPREEGAEDAAAHDGRDATGGDPEVRALRAEVSDLREQMLEQMAEMRRLLLEAQPPAPAGRRRSA